jgi:hypothetical protein
MDTDRKTLTCAIEGCDACNKWLEKHRQSVFNKIQNAQNVRGPWPWCAMQGCKAQFAKLYVHPDGEYPEPYCEDHAQELEMEEYPGMVE